MGTERVSETSEIWPSSSRNRIDIKISQINGSSYIKLVGLNDTKYKVHQDLQLLFRLHIFFSVLRMSNILVLRKYFLSLCGVISVVWLAVQQ
jgi:hypothetical protein